MQPADDNSKNKEYSRRELLRSVLRISALGAVAATGYKLATHKNSGIRHTCIADQICSRCSEAVSCQLPQALSYRTVNKKSPEKRP